MRSLTSSSLNVCASHLPCFGLSAILLFVATRSPVFYVGCVLLTCFFIIWIVSWCLAFTGAWRLPALPTSRPRKPIARPRAVVESLGTVGCTFALRFARNSILAVGYVIVNETYKASVCVAISCACYCCKLCFFSQHF